MSEKSTGQTVTSCFGVLMWLLVTQPLWFALLFGVLHKIDAPTWMWACYWTYVPAVLISGMTLKIADMVFTESAE